MGISVSRRNCQTYQTTIYMINTLCILGGGTSGLVAALMFRKAYPRLKITLIESTKLGIIGVGEGTTEHWRFFTDYCEIPLNELFEHTGATFKIGIKFTNWHGDGSHYFHSLLSDFAGVDPKSDIPYTWYRMIGENWDPLQTLGNGSQNSRHYEPLHTNINQFHFDTVKLNNFLHDKCTERDITIVDSIIEQVELDEFGHVKNLVDSANQDHAYDFYVDCSGFKRVIGDKLGIKWIDKSEFLPMNSAVAFQTPYKEDIPSYTEATALSSGWSWRIPTQDRFGNGYVYCDNFINQDAAILEVQEHYQKHLEINDITIGKKLKFAAGHVDKFWTKNCAVMGLCSIFVEPLEASSIGTTIQQCANLVSSMPYFIKGQESTANQYNRLMTKVAENVVDFIQLHYFTQRSDSEFWRWCKNSIKVTDFNQENIDYFRRNNVDDNFFREPLLLFKTLNFMQVMHGLRLFDPRHSLKVYDEHLRDKYDDQIEKMLILNADLTESIPHRECLEILKKRVPVVKYKF